MNSDKTGVFTIGHSTHEFSDFVNLLKRHDVTAVADVRSQPQSRLTQYCRNELEARLKANEIQYVFLGKELGARRDEEACYIQDRADYNHISRLPAFAAGLERIERGSQSHVVALMCAEKEPLDCHRMVLVSRHLSLRGSKVSHILPDGGLESQEDAERRLIRMMGVERTLFEPDLTDEELANRAYELRGQQIAYRKTQERSVK